MQPRSLEFRFVMDFPATSHGMDGRAPHINSHDLAGMLFRARNTYVNEAVGLVWTENLAKGRNLILRQSTVDYEREIREPVDMRAGIRAVSRGKSSIVLDELLWLTEGGEPVARGRSVHVLISLGPPPSSLALPEDVLARFEGYEGQPLTVRS